MRESTVTGASALTISASAPENKPYIEIDSKPVNDEVLQVRNAYPSILSVEMLKQQW